MTSGLSEAADQLVLCLSRAQADLAHIAHDLEHDFENRCGTQKVLVKGLAAAAAWPHVALVKLSCICRQTLSELWPGYGGWRSSCPMCSRSARLCWLRSR